MAISSSVDLRALPAVTFAPLSTSEVEASILTSYEGLTGVSLQPGDPVRLFWSPWPVVSVQNRLLNLAGQQGLLAYAQGAHLDHLGALMGVARIPAQSARLSLRFVLGEPLGFAVPIPEGTRVLPRTARSRSPPSRTAKSPPVSCRWMWRPCVPPPARRPRASCPGR